MTRIHPRPGTCAWLLAGAVMLAAPAAAQEQGARHSIRQACAADVHRLCADVTRGGGRIRRCMIDKREQLSDGCKTALSAARSLTGP